MKKRVPTTGMTTIRVHDEHWSVPRGFGAVYLRVLQDHAKRLANGDDDALIDQVIGLLALVGYAATPEQVATWDLRRRVEALIYASTEHARAGDNPIQRHPRPAWLPAWPWKGTSCGEGIFEGPSGTPITEVA